MRQEASQLAEGARWQSAKSEMEAMAKAEKTAAAAGRSGGASNGQTRSKGNGAGSAVEVELMPMDFTLSLQFPIFPTPDGTALPPYLESSSALQSRLSSLYGSIEHVLLQPQAGPSTSSAEGKEKKKSKKPKGAKAVVEFKKTNKDGCWACWRDHNAEDGKKARPLLEGLKVKFAGTAEGEVPAWVRKLELQAGNAAPMDAAPQPQSSRISSSFASSFPAPAATGFLPSTFPTPESRSKREKEEKEKREAQAFESDILFRMRQAERERLEREIRMQEDADE